MAECWRVALQVARRHTVARAVVVAVAPSFVIYNEEVIFKLMNLSGEPYSMIHIFFISNLIFELSLELLSKFQTEAHKNL